MRRGVLFFLSGVKDLIPESRGLEFGRWVLGVGRWALGVGRWAVILEQPHPSAVIVGFTLFAKDLG
jgi:hypothetical protein